MAIEALEGLTDEDLFNGANADEEPAEEAVTEAADEPEEQTEQARDEAGRFAGKPENEPEPVVAADPLAKPSVDDNAPQVPSWRVREINEEKRALAEKVAALEAERQNWQRQQQAPRAEPVAKPEPEEPDPLLDPKGYREFVLNQTREVILNERREASLERAHLTYKEEFQEAYAAAQKQVDPALKARMQQSRDPGETLIQWHRENKTRAEVGTDLTAYKQRLREEALKDPEFRKQAMEAWRSDAQQQPGSRPVSLPPSLTRTTNAGTVTSADDDDVSNDGLWRHANA